MIHRPDGIWTTDRRRFSHSTNEVGISPTPQALDILLSGDTYFRDTAATTNFDGTPIIAVGESNAAAQINRAWIQPDFSTVPSEITILSAILKLAPSSDLSSNARTMRAHRCLRDVIVNQATWNEWKTSNNWAAGGASSSGNDYDALEMGSGSIPASPPIGTYLTAVTFVAAEMQKLYDGTYINNGIILFIDTQVSDLILYESSENTEFPIISLTYI